MTFEEYISGMSLRDMATHIMCPALRCSYKDNADAREYFDYVFKDPSLKPGTVFYFPGQKEEIRAMTKKLDAMLPTPPLIAMDMETGPGCVAGTTGFSSAMAISAANNVEDAYTCGEACAVEGFEVGITWAFGPVVDLNRNLKNPIVNTRSWGDDPDHVAEFTTAFMKGMQDNGMIASCKHFPGDGMDDRDQHLCTTINSCSMEEWRATYGKVWKSAIDNGLRAIMPGHISLPAYEKDGAIVPATMSHALLTDLLRGELGFDGLIVSDGMNMGGLATYASVEDCIVGMVNAGVDVLLFPNFFADITYVADVLENALKDGRITVERIKESIYRIWREKERLGLLSDTGRKEAPCPPEKKAHYEEVARRIQQNSFVISRNWLNVLPLNKEQIKTVISVDVTSYRSVNNTLDAVLEKRGIKVLKYGPMSENGSILVEELPPCDAILLNFYYGPNWATNHILPNGEMLQRVYEYFFKSGKPSVLICHGNPYIPYVFPYAKTVIDTFTTGDDSETLAKILFGEAEAKGVCPVKLPLS